MKHLRIPLLLSCAAMTMIASWYLSCFLGFNAFDVVEESLSVDLNWALRHGTETNPNFARDFAIMISISLVFALSGTFIGARLTQGKQK